MASTALPLACLPFAGSGAGVYRAWRHLDSDALHIVPIQLPGREELYLESAFIDAVRAARWLTPRVLEAVGGQRFALFGHSLGAVLAYEIAQELARTGNTSLQHVYVSGSPGPGHVRENQATGLDDEAFLARVREFAGYRHSALDSPDLRELLLPTLRSDVEMHENYRPSTTEPLRVPVTALRGVDDTLVTAEQVRGWEETTVKTFTHVELPGGHMYLVDGPEALLNAISGS
ncbi:thioesterase II family protein [Lentzea flaviverrucosa]|uniref:Surfactin synthase thioesterase subunit n=1 Tax=Lentzea flaviverrucosa TaxID=200379 RepID=A0A1H9SDZ2_9PSEU|nr:alpha/beta fold hydrolase [Lentzea flaviverrucosa]RDI25334.1 surfactin synthase thioesterase subunit [Lentzea flaviverrucosa]SER83197.1 Surfactin synthase thioesterase subunit [Lentzea flaviverrucosa]